MGVADDTKAPNLHSLIQREGMNLAVNTANVVDVLLYIHLALPLGGLSGTA